MLKCYYLLLLFNMLGACLIFLGTCLIFLVLCNILKVSEVFRGLCIVSRVLYVTSHIDKYIYIYIYICVYHILYICVYI